MAAKTFFVVCASALLAQTISAQCLGGFNNVNYSPNMVGSCGSAPFNPLQLSTSGGGLTVTSTSPIAPSGIKVISENSIDGAVAVTGQLPVLAAIGLEGSLPTVGSVSTTYSCGNGNIGITSELGAPSNIGAGLAAGPLAGPVYTGPAGPSGQILASGQIGIGNGCNGLYY